jgi:hypothetical protein
VLIGADRLSGRHNRLAGQPVDLPKATSLQTVSPAQAFRHTRHERATSESSGDAAVLFASVSIASAEHVIVVDPTSREQQKLS